MPHQIAGRKLSRKTAARKGLFANLIVAVRWWDSSRGFRDSKALEEREQTRTRSGNSIHIVPTSGSPAQKRLDS